MAVFVSMMVVVIVIAVMMQPWIRQNRACHLMPQLAFEALLDSRVLLWRFDLLDFKRNSEPFWKIALRNGPIARFSVAGVEVLVIPVVRRRDDGARFPIDLARVFVLLESVLAEER